MVSGHPRPPRHDLLRLGSLTLPVEKRDPRMQPAHRFTYVDISAVDQNSKEIASPSEVLGADAPSRARQMLETGDVLVSTVRPNLNAVALVGPEHRSSFASTGFCVLRCNSTQLDERYLFHWVRTRQFVDQMVQLASGASYPAVSDRIVKNSEIPLPPIAEQRRIAAHLIGGPTAGNHRRIKRTRLETSGGDSRLGA